MSNQNIERNSVRIPNLPMGRIVDDNGKPTDEELTFRQSLLTLLQQIAGTEGLVAPSQSATNIASIQSNQINVEGASNNPLYTCAGGTIIYNTTNDTLQVAILSAGVPSFKTFTVT